eukprot:scaffold8336_cov94-Isochrysis_galbana.AAC.3
MAPRRSQGGRAHRLLEDLELRLDAFGVELVDGRARPTDGRSACLKEELRVLENHRAQDRAFRAQTAVRVGHACRYSWSLSKIGTTHHMGGEGGRGYPS